MRSKKSQATKKMVRITMEVKKEIIKKYEGGMRVRDLAAIYRMPRTTISSIVKNKEVIKAANVAKGVKSITKQRSETLEHVEKLLLIWITEKQYTGDSLSEPMICEKAKLMHADLLKKKAGTSQENEVFKASHGWFDNFKKRTGIHSITRRGQRAIADKDGANDYVTESEKFMEAESFVPQQGQVQTPSDAAPTPSTSSGQCTSSFMTDYEDPATLLSVSYDQENDLKESYSNDDCSSIFIKEEPIFEEYIQETEQEVFPEIVHTSTITKQEMSDNEQELNDPNEEDKLDNKFFEIWSGKINVPSTYWAVNKIIVDKKIVSLLKLYVPKSGIPVIEKQMVITEDMQIKWFIFMKEIGSMSYFSEQFFENFMKHFESMKVCYGGSPNENKDSVISSINQYTLDHYLNVWRHKNCPLVIEDSHIEGNTCKFCWTVVIPANIAEHGIVESKGTVLWRERFKSSQKEVRDLKETNEDLQKRVTDLQKYIDSLLVD